GRQDAADVEGRAADDGVVSGLPPGSGAAFAAERPGLQPGVDLPERSSDAGAGTGQEEPCPRGSAHQLLRGPPMTIHSRKNNRRDLTAVRARLAGEGGARYWRSLEELADTEEFREFLHREFPTGASEWSDLASRRTFLKLMGASLALAGAAGGCGS